MATRTSVNLLWTLISQDERLSVYNASSELVSSAMENTITKVYSDEVVKNYVKTLKLPKVLYECSKLSIYGTDYRPDQFILLPESTNVKPVFGRISKLLSCQKFGYLYYEKTVSTYSPGADIFMIRGTEEFYIVPCQQLPTYRTIEGYCVGERNQISLSLRNYIAESW